LIRRRVYKRKVVIALENVSKSFGSTLAVDRLSFRVGKGEVVGFLGPNAAGKSTTMRLIVGYLAPDKGRILINNRPVEGEATWVLDQIGYLPENNPLYKDMTVSDLIEFSADLKRIPHSERGRAFDFVVSTMGIGDVFYRRLGELSKGYRQRVGMGLALLHRPPILILDEPTEGLDPNQRAEIRSLIKSLASDHTIILSTHVMPEAAAVCNRLLIINKGRLVADGTADELVKAGTDHQRLTLEVEGKNVRRSLKKLKGVDELHVEPVSPNRLKATLLVKPGTEIQPPLSALIRDQGWVVWRLTPEEQGLEEVFRELTVSP
jgi:ABC-2 type transport system ATP-binding protein